MPAPHKPKITDSVNINHEQCWAKTTADGRPGINVRDHCLNVGCVAEALLELLPAQVKTLHQAGAATLAALHDIGKVSPGFQQKCKAWLVQHGLAERALQECWHVRETDHAKISQFTVQQMLSSSHLHRLAAVVGAHHGQIKGERVQVCEPWEEERQRLAAELICTFGDLPIKPADEAALWCLAGLITVADWIGSNETHFPQEANGDPCERRRRAQAALAAIGWRVPHLRGNDLEFEDLFPSYKPNSLQNAAIKTIREPGVYVIEGPMGCGKTEAALAAAYQLLASGKASGIYFALPTQVTSNRIYLRVEPFVQRICADTPHVRLAHSTSWLVQAEQPLELRPTSEADDEAQKHVQAGRSWFASAKRALLAPFGVGTIDQALLGIVAAKHFFVRQFGLAGKVVILDEVHSYDLYTGTLIDALVKRLRELYCTVIVLSATLTKARRRQLLQVDQDQPLSDSYPLLSAAGTSPIQVPCKPPPAKIVSVRFDDPDSMLADCLDRARQGQCVLWIRNTVDEAQETYRRLMATNCEGGPPIGLLHARFPLFRREELEAKWMEALGKNSTKRPAGCVLVATQVAEQSVDIDADLLITDLAPTDMLLQRLGRLWRHDRPNRPGRPEIWIRDVPMNNDQLESATEKELRAALGKGAKVYAPYVLLRSLQQWRARNTITLPTDIRAILEATYAEPSADEPQGWRELREQLEKHKHKLERFALSATNIWFNPALSDEEDVQTRYSTYPMAQLLLATEITTLDLHSARLCLLDGTTVTAHDRDWNFETAKAIHRNLVRVPWFVVKTALMKRPGWLTNHVSQPTAVGRLLCDGSIRWPDDERQTGLSYHADQGIMIEREFVPQLTEEDWDESYD
ncbi:MAG: CRISPR-associated helicase Cas3' [Acidobacteriota bacterium]|nr:CRISPR-associated helicase Cas3' [Blastocatellia bacterium]MDW8240440.1 CRISPR-associated helicase Cas3' [Acidobacteriota bacterium]